MQDTFSNTRKATKKALFIVERSREGKGIMCVLKIIRLKWKSLYCHALCAVAALTISDAALATGAAGEIDTNFFTGAGFNGYVQSIALLPDGSIVAGGNFNAVQGYFAENIIHLLPDGHRDSNFLASANGTVEQVVTLAPAESDTNGGILIVGDFTQIDESNFNGVARLNLDGSLDEDFNPGAGAEDAVYATAQMFVPAAVTNQPNIPCYVLGGAFASFDGVPEGGVARLTQSGVLDSSFNTGIGASGGPVYAVAIQSNNQILLGGSFTSFNGAAHHYLVRLNVDGSTDANFSAFDGVSSDIDDSVYAILVQPDGKILVGGAFTSIDGNNYNSIARLNCDGSVGTGFNVGVGLNGDVFSLALDSQMRILVGGDFSDVDELCNGITRLTTNGTEDTTINFGSGVNGNGAVYSIAIQTNDEIDVGGEFVAFDYNRGYNFVCLYGGANYSPGSLPLLNASLVAGGGLQLQATGLAPSANFMLQYATNLSPPVTWQPFVTNAADSNGNWTFIVTNAAAFPAMFFRVAIP
jgi:uncharacterized delta-60 repeat protein